MTRTLRTSCSSTLSMINSAKVNELNVLSRRERAANSALRRLSRILGSSSSNCDEAQSDLKRPTEKVAATSDHIPESAGKRREVVSSSFKEKFFLSSRLASNTASAILVAKGFTASIGVVNIVYPPLLGLRRVLMHCVARANWRKEVCAWSRGRMIVSLGTLSSRTDASSLSLT